MEKSQQSFTTPPEEKKWILPALYITAALGAAAAIVLFALLMINNTSMNTLNQEMETTTQELSTLENNATFQEYRVLAKSLTPPKVSLGDFLSTITTTLESYGSVSSIDITTQEELPPTVTLLLESTPPLATVADLLEQMKGLTNIDKPVIDTINSSQNELGQFIYTYPISFSLPDYE